MGVGDDAADHPQISPHGGARRFPVGSLVEVLVNEVDMGGVYFSATVVPPPRKRNTTNSGEMLHVKYHNLLAREGGAERLRELVDVSTVRPAPPLLLPEKRFRAGDVVDAFYADGWWMGVVSGVGGGGERFVLTFDNPPDEQEFGPAALRAHWDWADGVWARLLKQGDFEVGEKVEISVAGDDDDCCKNAWFPAVIVGDLKKGEYLVEFKDKKGGCVKAEINAGKVRPSPPIFKNRKFRASERVDAFFDFGWWSGLIKKKAHKNGYIVFFEQTNLNKLFNPSQLRPHVDWSDGKWLLTDAAAVGGKSSPFLKKHDPQIEHENEESSEDECDWERRTKRMEDAPPIEGENWPFVKRSSVWKAVESMAVLRSLPPQRPHFKPLRQFRKISREGIAIAYIVSLSSVVEASRGLKFGDPKQVVDDVHQTLEELEVQGFEVGALKGRVAELVAAKEEEERLLKQARGIVAEMEERGRRRSRIEWEIETMNGHIRRLQEQLQIAGIHRVKEIEEIAKLQGGLEETKMKMESLRCEFEGVFAQLE